MAKFFNRDNFDIQKLSYGSFIIREIGTNACFCIITKDRLAHIAHIQKHGEAEPWDIVYAVVFPKEFNPGNASPSWDFLKDYDPSRPDDTLPPIEAKGYIKRGLTKEQAIECTFANIDELFKTQLTVETY